MGEPHPTPWRSDGPFRGDDPKGYDFWYYHLYDAAGDHVGLIEPAAGVVGRIIAAVNAHAALVASLRGLLDVIRRAGDEHIINGMEGLDDAELPDDWALAIERAEAAAATGPS